MDNHQQPDYGQYGWYSASAQAPETQTFAQEQVLPQPEANMARFRRYAAAGVLAIAMIAGGSAVVLAASPDPSASPTPGTPSGQDGSGGAGGSTDNGRTTPRANHPCPKDGANGSGTNGSDDGSSSDQSTDSTIDATAL